MFDFLSAAAQTRRTRRAKRLQEGADASGHVRPSVCLFPDAPLLLLEVKMDDPGLPPPRPQGGGKCFSQQDVDVAPPTVTGGESNADMETSC